MKILVCIKQVPDTASKLKIAPDGKSIDTAGLEFIVAPYDEIAVEHAVQCKEKRKDVEIVILSMGTAESEKSIRRCLAMGADRGILLQTAASLADSFAVAKALSAVISEEKPDAVLFGIKATDDDNAQVGAMVSELCHLAFIESAGGIEWTDSGIQAKCEIEGSTQTLRAAFPCAVSVNKGEIKEPRICSLINIRKAGKKELKSVACQPDAPALAIDRLAYPPERKAGKIVGQGADAVPELFRLLKEEAKIL